jgi:proteic killer suppression protein
LKNILGLYSVASHYTLGTGETVIETIKHKILSLLEAANHPQEIALPMFRFHPLTGDRSGTYSVTVKANWRVTFRFHEGAAYDVDLGDYH